MDTLAGYKTILASVIGLIASAGAYTGIVIPESDQAALTSAIMAIAAIVLRLVTKGPVARPKIIGGGE